MIIPTDAEKVFNKIQHPFIIITLNRTSTEGMYINVTKVIHDKTTVIIILNEKLKHFPTELPLWPTFIQHSIESPSQSN